MNEILSYRCKVSSRLSSSSRACKSSSGHGKMSSKVRGADGIVLVAAPGTEPSVKQWKGATDQSLQHELDCAHRPNCHTVLETWSCPLPYQSLGSPKKPKVCMRSQLMHSIAESAPDGKVHGACRVHTTLSLSPLNFLCPELWQSWQHPFWMMCKSSTQDKYTIIHLTECNNMQSQASISSRHCLPGAWLRRRMFSFSFRLSS